MDSKKKNSILVKLHYECFALLTTIIRIERFFFFSKYILTTKDLCLFVMRTEYGFVVMPSFPSMHISFNRLHKYCLKIMFSFDLPCNNLLHHIITYNNPSSETDYT